MMKKRKGKKLETKIKNILLILKIVCQVLDKIFA